MYIGMVTQFVSIIIIWVGICTSWWGCGDLIKGCNSDGYKNIRYVLFAGAGCISIAFLLGILRFFILKPVIDYLRLVVQFAGGILMLSGLIVYYSLESDQISGFITTMGSSGFIFVSVFGIADMIIPNHIA